MEKSWPYKKVRDMPENLQAYHTILRQRKQRTLDEKWDIETQITDAIEDLEFKLTNVFLRTDNYSIDDIDVLSGKIPEQIKQIDLSDTKPKPAHKIAIRLFLKTHDFNLACNYSLAKTARYLQKAHGAMEGCHNSRRLGKAFRQLLRATEEYGVYMSLQRYASTRSIQTRMAANKKLSIDPKQAAKKEVLALWEEWKKAPERYKSQSAFARDMLDKFDALRSQSVVEGWCRVWKKTLVS